MIEPPLDPPEDREYCRACRRQLVESMRGGQMFCPDMECEGEEEDDDK